MKTREELIEVMRVAFDKLDYPFIRNYHVEVEECGKALMEAAFDALIAELPCHESGYSSQNSLWLQELKAMGRE